MPETHAKQADYWPERLFVLLVSGLMTLTLLSVFSIRTGIIGATDLKTLYGSAWNLRHGADAFSFQNIATVLRANGVTPAPTAYGHNAVYPPFTLVLLEPLTLIPLVPLIWLWAFAGSFAIAAAFAALTRAAGDEFAAGRGRRFLLLLIAFISPMFIYATIIQNVSLMAAALSLLAVASQGSTRWRGIGLAIALLLKPHVAFWALLSLLLVKRTDGRKVAFQALQICVAFVILCGVWLSLHHQLTPQLHSYTSALRDEVGRGSMSPTRRDVMAAGLQITSLASLIGFWQTSSAVINTLSTLALASLGGILLWATWRANRRPQPELDRARFVITGAWCSFGLIATYHRAHDALILVVLLPWLVAGLWPARGTPFRVGPMVLPWTILALLMLLAAIIAPVRNGNASDYSHSWNALLHFRQAPLFAAGLAALLAIQMVLLDRKTQR